MPRFVKPSLGQEIAKARFPHYLVIDSKLSFLAPKDCDPHGWGMRICGPRHS